MRSRPTRAAFALAIVMLFTAGALMPFAHADPVQTYRVDIHAPREVAVGDAFEITGHVTWIGGIPSPLLVSAGWPSNGPVVELYQDGTRVDSTRTNTAGGYAFTVQHDVQEPVTFHAVARDSAGFGSESAHVRVDVVTLSGAPGAVTSERGLRMDDADLTWPAPAATGGSRALAYRVYEVHADGRVAHVANTSVNAHRLSGVTPDAERSFFVTAVNAAGEGPAGPTSTVSMPSPFAVDEVTVRIDRVAVCEERPWLWGGGEWCTSFRENQRNDGRNGAPHDYHVWVEFGLRSDGAPVPHAPFDGIATSGRTTSGEVSPHTTGWKRAYTGEDGTVTLRFGPFDGRIYRTTGCDWFSAIGVAEFPWTSATGRDEFKWRMCAVR